MKWLMMVSSNGNIFHITGHLCGEFTGIWWIPCTKASDAAFWFFFDLSLNKWLRKQSSGWWFETLLRPLWRHCNVLQFSLIGWNLASCKDISILYSHKRRKLCYDCMMTSSNGNIFSITGPLWGEFTSQQWLPLTKDSGLKLWCFLWSAPEQTVEQK